MTMLATTTKMVTTTVSMATVTQVDNGDGKMEKVKMKVRDGKIVIVLLMKAIVVSHNGNVGDDNKDGDNDGTDSDCNAGG